METTVEIGGPVETLGLARKFGKVPTVAMMLVLVQIMDNNLDGAR